MKNIFFSILMVFTSINVTADDVYKVESAYANQTSDLQVSSSGTVVKLLSDDNKGSRHQRFILKLSNNQTVLVAHNIDLAPKITSLRRGDIVEFNGEYEWNNKGGVIHWTHHDPAGRHQDGWLKHNGSIYE
jgi:molybdopterin converting factor small subunit